MRFLVTGGAGFIGSHIAEALLADGHSVRIIDNLRAGSLKRISHIMDSIEFIKADIRDGGALRSAMRECDGVFHQAALVSVQESYVMKQEYHDVNVTGTKNVLEHAADLGIKAVYASSSSVYGNPQSTPTREDAPLRPENPYGATKADAEAVAQECIRSGASVVGLRYFNVYGSGQTGTYAGVITQFMRRLEEAKPPIINGDGTQSRDFVYVGDAAAANLSAIFSRTDSGFFNIGTGKGTTINQLARIMTRVYSLDMEPEYADALPGDVMASRADTLLASQAIPWTHATELDKGLSEVIRRSS
ncbi:MAG: NAD-dependent epimerase/dehydratase family protein [Thaumarchaeota archaeon]|nr:NAD-dependent epimerase/dehydratase family protein [Nitrososphaerota archaeon]